MNTLALIDILFFAVVFSPVCIAIHVIFTNEGMFGYEVGNFLEAVFPEWISKPLFTCPTCMASIWGSLFWFCSGGSFSGWWIVAVFMLSGLNKLAEVILYGSNE